MVKPLNAIPPNLLLVQPGDVEDLHWHEILTKVMSDRADYSIVPNFPFDAFGKKVFAFQVKKN